LNSSDEPHGLGIKLYNGGIVYIGFFESGSVRGRFVQISEKGIEFECEN
jgi:hypothetical protein